METSQALRIGQVAAAGCPLFLVPTPVTATSRAAPSLCVLVVLLLATGTWSNVREAAPTRRGHPLAGCADAANCSAGHGRSLMPSVASRGGGHLGSPRRSAAEPPFGLHHGPRTGSTARLPALRRRRACHHQVFSFIRAMVVRRERSKYKEEGRTGRRPRIRRGLKEVRRLKESSMDICDFLNFATASERTSGTHAEATATPSTTFRSCMPSSNAYVASPRVDTAR